MKKSLILLILISLIGVTSSFSLEGSIYSKFEVPVYKYSSASISGQNLLSWYKHGDYSSMYVNLGADYDIFSQKTDFTWYYNENLDFNLEKVENSYDVDNKILEYYDNFSAAKYFGLLQAYGYGGFDLKAQNEVKPYKRLDLEVGGGAGRIIYCTTVAQAIAVVKELDAKLSDQKVLEIADLIGKKYWYSVTYKDEWKEYFYKDLANAIGKPDAALTIMRILEGGVYTISSRSTGWQVRVGYSNYFLTDDDPKPKGDIQFRADYAKPIGLDMQFGASAGYAKHLEEDAGATMYAGVDFTLDHDFTWASFAGFDYEQFLADTGDNPDPYYRLYFGTRKNILNKLVSEIRFVYYKYSGSDDPSLNFFIDFIYSLW
ncbi:MAG: hypothetical protein KAW87_08010 [Candidatus Cloacimonetes bacterium]|nr:hypothetical protein [Candidatus Cloacimonadota bacterium]